MRNRNLNGWTTVVLAGTLAAGCAAALVHPTADDARWAAGRWPETTLSDLEHGRSLYVEKCAGCHHLHLPDEFTPGEWEGYVAYMVAEAKLAPSEQVAITRYLAAASARARGAGAADDTTRTAGP